MKKYNWLLRIFTLLFLVFNCLHAQTTEITITAVGDIMPGTDYPSEKYLPPQDMALIDSSVVALLNKSEFLTGNLEGCLIKDGFPSQHKKSSFLFRIPQHLSAFFTNGGFDYLSLANNHTGDFGDSGRIETVKNLDSLQIASSGFLDKQYCLIEKNDMKIVCIALAPFRGCLSHWQKEEVEALLDSLSYCSDFIIASLHYGSEGGNVLHVTGNDEFLYSENRGNPLTIAHWLIDCGVDFIYGHSPHVPRALELYKGKLIAYSLGNFITWGRFNLDNERGFAPILEAKYDKEGNFIGGSIISCLQDYGLPLFLDSSAQAGRLIEKLSKEDFPESPLEFTHYGEMTKIKLKE